MVTNSFATQFMGKEVFTDIFGQTSTKQQLKSALLMGRHVIIAGPPGIGKTTLAKNVARLLPTITVNDCEFNCSPKTPACPKCRAANPKTKKALGEQRFVRVQGSPDLTAEDLLGDIDPVKALKFGPTSSEAFSPGKLFKANNGMLFFDELNRSPEKLQNALLQVLEEGKATLGSYSVDLPADFIFIGTMNPDETAATEKLSDVFLDRFDIIHMGYPETSEVERAIVRAKGKQLQVEFSNELLDSALQFVRQLREHKDVQKKPSVRASIGVFERSQANAFLAGRKIVMPQDIADAILSVLSHRMELKPAAKYLQSTDEFVLAQFKNFLKDHQEFGEKVGGSL